MSLDRLSVPRFGLVGTGNWARKVHAPSAAASPDVQFVSVYGRDPAALESMRVGHGVAAFVDFGEFLAGVDIVGFAVPPDAQSGLALLAADSRKHLLLEKPVAIDPTKAWAIADRLSKSGCSSVVLFTHLLRPSAASLIEKARLMGGWVYARSESFSRAFVDPDSPYFDLRWRRERGALWDTAPHAVAVHCRILGDVMEVSASTSMGGLTCRLFFHASSALSNVTVTLDAPATLPGGSAFFGTPGAWELPKSEDWQMDANRAHSAALALLGRAWSGEQSGFAPDAGFGAHITSVIDAAERSIRSGRRERPKASSGG